MNTRIHKKGPVYLRFDDGQVFVTPQDYDHFLIAARPAIDALRHACNAEVWVKSFFEDYVPLLHQWCRARSDQITACYVALLAVPSLKALVLVPGGYDMGLGEEIAQLELDLEAKGWPSDIMQLPATGDEEELHTFFKMEDSIQVYAKTQTAQEKADHNRTFLDTISAQGPPDWMTTIAFYVAVHLVEKLRAYEGEHSENHDERRSAVKRHHPALQTAFYQLYTISRLARYGTSGQFTMTVADVKTTLIDKYLVAIEQYVAAETARRSSTVPPQGSA